PTDGLRQGAVCSECGRWYGLDELIRYEGNWICGRCKPLFVQRLKEGTRGPVARQALLGELQLLQRDYRIDIGDCLVRAWILFATRPGLVIFATLVSGAAFLGLWLVSILAGFVIPLGGEILTMMFSGPLLGGFIWFFLRLARGEAAEVTDVFAGFRRQFAQLLLASLVQGLIYLACMIPVMLTVLVLALIPLLTQKSISPAMIAGLIAGTIAALMLAAAVVLFLTTIWTFSLILVVDKGYAFWPAMQLSRKMVMKRFWMTLAFVVVATIIMSAGMFACVVGLLVTVPLFYAMKVFLYEDNFRDLSPPTV
ncbi:MAG: hypothetical protein N3B01_08355, partial [Verrucomicrobiae bacterium]|nr:hypothetical protein [Verrucomicrobiae bacterium]